METEILRSEKKVLAPDLRFKGFQEEWKNCRLGEVTEYTKGFAFKSKDYQRNGVRIVRVSDLAMGSIKKVNDKVFLDVDKATKYNKYKLYKGNIVITTVGSKPEMLESAVGRGIYIDNEEEGLLNQNMLKFENISGISNRFLFGLINSRRYQHYMKGIARGNANQANITVVDLLHYKISIPGYQEQQKIATFLSAVDKKIQQLSRKKELLDSYKKGVMEKLFSREIRFKDEDGKDFPEWERKKYGEIYSFLSTNSFSRDQLNYENGEVKNIHYGDIHTKLPTLFHLKNKNIPYVNSEIDISKIKEENYCREGDLIIADASEDYKDIGKAIELIALYNEKVLAGLHTFIARPAKGKISKGFSGYLMKSWKLRKQIMTIAQGTKVLGLSATRMKNLKLEIPSLEEQQKIADFLSAIDQKIEAVSQQIEKTQTFKKGLLQQMFV